MEKKAFLTKQQAEKIAETYPTPWHIYDEKGIRENAAKVQQAFAWNPGFREYFAVKATPNPFLLDILKEYGCGTDCSSMTELMMSEACGFSGEQIMFSSNDTPPQEFAYADRLGAIINLDDITHIDVVEQVLGKLPETMSCRYNPGGMFELSNGIMDNPGDSKYGMMPDQITEAFKIMKAKGVKRFGIHAFLASNTVTNEYYPKLAGVLFREAVRLKKETGADIRFVNLSGGVGIPYRPEQEPNGPGASVMKAKLTTGTSGCATGIPEYVTVLEISFVLRDALIREGADVYLTRETHDVNISNQERARMMNALGVDLVLRIHCNGSSNPSANGIGLYVNKSYAISAESRRAAECILPRMAEATGARQRGIFLRDTYTGLNWSAVPAILVECGYLTNPVEDEKLNDPAFQQKLAEGMVEGICDYFESLQP